MDNINLKYLKVENFLCFREGIEVYFTSFGNIINIQGENLDDSPEDGSIASNGAGKTSFFDAIVYGLYGKTVKKPKKITHSDVVHNTSKKNLLIEIRLNNLRIVRTREHSKFKNSLRVWEVDDPNFDWDDWIKNKPEQLDELHEKTLVGSATQDLIESKLGITYDTFVNLIIFDDKSDKAFLECDGPTKRSIVENLLGLEKYRQFHETAKEMRNGLKESIKNISKEYERLNLELNSALERIEQIKGEEVSWKKTKISETMALKAKLDNKKSILENTDNGKAIIEYENAQKELTKVNAKLLDLENQKNILSKEISSTKESITTAQSNKLSIQLELKRCKSEIDEHKGRIKKEQDKIQELRDLKTGMKCDRCHGVVHENNYKSLIIHSENIIGVDEVALKECAEIGQKFLSKLTENDKLLNEYNVCLSQMMDVDLALNDDIKTFRDLIISLNKISKPTSNSAELLLQQEIEELTNQIRIKKHELENSPYVNILKTAVKDEEKKREECENKKKEVEGLEADLPYYEFWVKAFGDAGIRKFVIEGIIPTLNSRLAYWMQYLTDSKFKITFDSELEEKIERNPSNNSPFVYHAMSGGEKRRVNLAVSQAFSHVMAVSCGKSVSVVFLDEVELNVDSVGILGIYNMIMELSRDKQVFVTTHNEKLLSMLRGCEVLKLRKKNGSTKIAVY